MLEQISIESIWRKLFEDKKKKRFDLNRKKQLGKKGNKRQNLQKREKKRRSVCRRG